ncbi:hypothetical protein HPC49_26360 [Pyxidicoccus fallax]|uniref:DUF4214 domain-containing protein n=1 Tax=Pyxidicoccus fallax TaxID=394095 RepID=A0A848LN98_9BACT|nr:hypothetical protein [Pyxidicoccus fallax]NMO19298.1 hypothetical protein [Pyxidicoccus fallax]NPC81731.1 hypothetical protein [Pyxidicoccus fallax]
MSSSLMKSFLSGVVLLAAPAALAGSATSIPAFDAKIAAARGATSPSGTTVVRAEMVDALAHFTNYDDGKVDTAERAYLTTKVSDATFLTGVDAEAKTYLTQFYELNDAATTAAPLYLNWVQQSPAELYGASGSLADASEIVEGYIPRGLGVANQVTLVQSAYETFRTDSARNFEPITLAELEETLATRYFGDPVTEAEVQGALTYINQISRNSGRIYQASWQCNGCGGGPGDLGGYIIAAVSSDRRFVRMVKVWTWTE